MSKPIELTLYTKPGCHLCDEAKIAVQTVISSFGSESDTEVLIQEVNILDNAELIEKYSDEIPVLQINGATHAYWRIDADRLLAALKELA